MRAARSRRRGLAFDAERAARSPRRIAEADRRPAAEAGGRTARTGREALGAAGRQDGAGRRAEAPARRSGRGEEGERRPAGHARLLRGRDPRLLHRPAAEEAAGRSTSRATASSKSAACRTTQGKGFVDYVLWGDDGKPLALVEAKRTKKSTRVSASSRRSSMPTAWSSSSGSGQSSSTRTATSTGCGTTRAIRRARCRASTRRPNWSC